MNPHWRPIRSFVLRTGRETPGQARAREALGARYAIPWPEAPLPADYWDRSFDVDGPLTLEIGFGMGGSLAAMAAAEPTRRFLGVEVHTPGVGALMAALEAQQLTNVRVLQGDVVAALAQLFQPGTLDRVQIFFPDPWPKKRHHKRRLIQPPFLERLATLVRPGGHCWLATDWAPYAEAMEAAFAAVPAWRQLPAEACPPRPETRFERRGLRKGHAVADLYFQRLP